ncbi:MAG: tRNA dihydrouridine synthase DusB [Verrucomicrobia bacterium 61-8]|nr:tRNA dihydrouridine synthase DusB [Verrucomicrobiota bacterium]OJV03413.1 MAG: tRNA dihydrouridine synthase DusB [Verrucomicrobia bacterium 61-8]
MSADFPIFLAPMAGVTNTVFRRICRAKGADVLTTEFVSAEGILHRNERTKYYLEFVEEERPLGVQLFGAEPERLAEAARAVIDWVRPDFLDLNFGCPVNKVVCKNGGSALLRDCPLLSRVAEAVVKASAPVPVTAKIRIGWDRNSVNATQTAAILEQSGIQRIAVHGRTKEQGYSGEADWNVIAQVAAAVKVPVIGNGDITSAADVLLRKRETGVSGVMIGRAAMASPWIFEEIQAALAGVESPAPPTMEERWKMIREHCEGEIVWRRDEKIAMKAMRARLMAYTRGMPEGARLRERLSHVQSIAQLDDIAATHLAHVAEAAA